MELGHRNHNNKDGPLGPKFQNSSVYGPSGTGSIDPRLPDRALTETLEVKTRLTRFRVFKLLNKP